MATTYNNLAVLAVYAYYISKTGDLKKMTLTLKEIDGSHTRENLVTVIYDIIEDWSISMNVGYFVIDNAVVVRMVKSTMLDFIVLQCRYHYLSMFLTISQPLDLTTEPATWSF